MASPRDAFGQAFVIDFLFSNAFPTDRSATLANSQDHGPSWYGTSVAQRPRGIYLHEISTS
jgi:hypothetical protein